jgi:predicted nucleic acid-binding protein
MASLMGLKITGLVGILGALKKQGEITSTEMPEILDALENVEFRLSVDLKRRLLE